MKWLMLLVFFIPTSIGIGPAFCQEVFRMTTPIKCYGSIVDMCETEDSSVVKFKYVAGWLPRSRCAK